MKIIYPRVCGIDVHKKFIVAVICISESVEPVYLKKRFSTFHNDLIRFRDWLIQNDCQNVCMESTGKYYIPVYNILESHISNIVVANPKWVRAVKGEKDDDKDAKWIADLLKLGIVKSSFIPQKDFRILRELTRYKYKLVNMRSSEKNRYQNALTSGNCKLDMVFTDVFGKSASNIQRLDKLIDLMIEPYEDYISFLCQIPGVSRNSAITILSEIGVDMNQFTSTRRLTSWAGLTPSSNQSAGKKKSVRISRAGVYLKPCLVEVAHAAVKDTNHPYYANKFNKISKRRGKKRAYIAIARKILVAAYHMLLTGEIWNPADLAEVETPVEQRIKYVKNNLKSDIKQLLDIGLTVEELTLMIQQNANNIATQ